MIVNAIGVIVNMRVNSIRKLYPGFLYYLYYIFQLILNVFKSMFNIYFIRNIIELIESDIQFKVISNKTVKMIASFFIINMFIKLLLSIFYNCLENYRYHKRHKNINYLEGLLLNVNYQTKDSNSFMFDQKVLLNFIYKDRIFNLINSIFNIIANVIILIYALCIANSYIIMLIATFILLGILLLLSFNLKHKADYEIEMFEDDISIKTEYLRGTLIDFNYGADIRIFRMQRKLKERLKLGSNVELRAFSKYYHKYFIAELLVIVAYLIFICMFYFYLGYQLVIEKTIKIAVFSEMIAAITTGYMAFKAIAYSVLENKYFKKYKNDFLEVYQKINLIDRLENLNVSIESIEFEDVSFKYPNSDYNALNHINLKFEKGKRYFIVGQNGVGKTTIYNLLLKFYDSYNGVIKINGKSINEINTSKYYDYFSALFQSYTLLPFTFRDNLNDNIDDDKVLELLKDFDIDNINLDANYSKRFDVNGIELSGGQLQKFAFIRAVTKNADVMIFDEPFSSLDIFSELKMYEYIKKNFSDKIVLITSHRLNVWKVCDEIIVVDNGNVIERGTHHSLMEINGKYCELYRKQEGFSDEE